MLFLRPFNERSKNQIFNSLGKFYELIYPNFFDDNELLKYAPIADVVLGNSVSDEFLYSTKNLKLFQTPSSGVDELNIKLLIKLGVEVGNSNSHSDFVAEHAIALALGMLKKTNLHSKQLLERAKKNKDFLDMRFETDTLIGKSVGFVGFGNINNAINKFLKPFKNKVYVFSRKKEIGNHNLSILELFRKSDLIFIALPLNKSTKNIINSEHLKIKSPCPYLINVGRAEVINKDDLLNALKSNTIRGFASDVPYGGKNNLSGHDEFLHYKNAFLSPHVGSNVKDITPYLKGVIDNLIEYASSQKLISRPNL